MKTLTEIWTQDIQDPDLWHGNYGVMVNTAALDEREVYFDITRVPSMPQMAHQHRFMIAR